MEARPKSIIHDLISLRLLVGFLGEKKQHDWWDCSFLNAVGIRFLETTFPRTARAAALRSTGEAARSVHDAATGKLVAFHLFRLPVEVEARIDTNIEQSDLASMLASISAVEQALEQLASFQKTALRAPSGPVQIGVETKILTANAVSELAAHYFSAFSSGFQCFPYFAAGK